MSIRTLSIAAAACALAAPFLAGGALAQTSKPDPATMGTTGSMQSPAPATTTSAPPPVEGGAPQPSAAAMSGQASMGAGAATSAYQPITPTPTMNIAAELQASGEFNTLIKALKATNLYTLVQANPNLTLIAPTDAAFAALPPDQLDALMKDPNKLQGVLTYHLIGAKVAPSKIKGHAAGPVTTAAKKPVIFDGSGTDIKIDGEPVLQAGVPASNGYIYVVGRVLMPSA